MWPFNNDKKYEKQITNLNSVIEELQDKIETLEAQLHNEVDVSLDFLNDFDYSSVDRVISIEGLLDSHSGLIKCTICYVLFINDGKGQYREWYTWCRLSQYQHLYDSYVKYKGITND